MAKKKTLKLVAGMYGFKRFAVHASDFIIASALFALLFMFSAEKPEICEASSEVASSLDCLIITFAENLNAVLETIFLSFSISFVFNLLISKFFGGTIGMLGMGYQYKNPSFKQLAIYFFLNRVELFWGAFGTWQAIFSLEKLSKNEKISDLSPVSLCAPIKNK